MEPTALVSFLATYQDLGWVLDDSQRELLLRLTPSAFDDDRGSWGLSLAQADALRKDAANVRLHAGEAVKAFEAARVRTRKRPASRRPGLVPCLPGPKGGGDP